jgi:cytochrome c
VITAQSGRPHVAVHYASGGRASALMPCTAVEVALGLRFRLLRRTLMALLTTGLALAAGAVATNAAACDRTLGEQAFAKCTACHSLQAGQQMMGPSLNGLRGRRAGSLEGFNFSSALRASGLVWNEVTLDAFLANPQSFVQGTVMPFGGLKDASERGALVCYLLGS